MTFVPGDIAIVKKINCLGIVDSSGNCTRDSVNIEEELIRDECTVVMSNVIENNMPGHELHGPLIQILLRNEVFWVYTSEIKK